MDAILDLILACPYKQPRAIERLLSARTIAISCIDLNAAYLQPRSREIVIIATGPDGIAHRVY